MLQAGKACACRVLPMMIHVIAEVTTVAKGPQMVGIIAGRLVAEMGDRQDHESLCPLSRLAIPFGAAPRTGMGAV